LSEFKDHGVVRSSNTAPDKVEGVHDDDDDDEEEDREGGQHGAEGGEWVWIPLAREALEEVLLELGIDE
jgi:origin recognition complex subunit 2